MHSWQQPQSRQHLSHALVLIHRYSIEITEIAAASLGRGDVDNRDIEVLLAVHGATSTTATELRDLTGCSRSTVTRAVARLTAVGLIIKTTDPADQRSVQLTLSPSGGKRVAAFNEMLSDYFGHGEPLAKEILALLNPDLTADAPAEALQPLEVAGRLSRTGSAYVSEAIEELRQYGISDMFERFAIALLSVHGQLRPSQLADEFHLSRSGTTGVLDRLESAGLVKRGPDPHFGDRRAVVVSLTPLGEEAMSTMVMVMERHQSSVAEAFAAVVSGRNRR